MEIVHAITQRQLAEAKRLVIEYAESLNIDLSFQDFDRELADFPGSYRRPTGCFLLACAGEQVAGGVALCPSGPGFCEMKRLYVRPGHRGQGIGRRLAQAAIAEARRIGYHRMRLDTLHWMAEAITLYKSLGFSDVEPYRYNPIEGARFMELVL